MAGTDALPYTSVIAADGSLLVRGRFKMVHYVLRAGIVGSAFLLAGCSLFRLSPADDLAQPQQPAAGIGQTGGPVVSPDGKKLLWHVQAENGMTLVRDEDSGETTIYRLGRNFPYWARDSRHLVVERDIGTGGTQILAIDTKQPKEPPLNITPWQDSKSFVLHIGDAPDNLLTFISNRRDRDVYDVYSADIRTAHVDLLYRNTGEVVQWVMDDDGTVGARVRRQDECYILQVLNKSSRTWKSVHSWHHTEAVLPVRIERDSGKALLVTNVSGEKRVIVELTLAGLGAKP